MSFDPEQWLEAAGPVEANAEGYWIVHGIASPYDACVALKIRDIVRSRVGIGEGVPTDMFILSTGEGPARACTKIGGLPFRRRHREWPKSDRGNPLPFLAQFDFRESKDLVGELPGDILLLFTHPHLHEGLVLEWETVSDTVDLVTEADVAVQPTVPCFHGTRWRTLNYLDWKEECLDIGNLEDGTTVLDIPLALELLGVQIGTCPYVPSWNPVAGENERIICSLCSVFPFANQPHPFLNRTEPLTAHEAEQLYLPIFEYDDQELFGVLYIVATETGDFRWTMEQL